ncbi:MAG: type II toxin-antitoxin system RelE/ParE family toxin [Cyanobacteriota bacterium]
MKKHYSKKFDKKFEKYERKTQERIHKAIELLPLGDVEKIQGKKTPPIYRLRVGDYRILFRMNEHEIFIDKVDGRGDVYKGL